MSLASGWPLGKMDLEQREEEGLAREPRERVGCECSGKIPSAEVHRTDGQGCRGEYTARTAGNTGGIPRERNQGQTHRNFQGPEGSAEESLKNNCHQLTV